MGAKKAPAGAAAMLAYIYGRYSSHAQKDTSIEQQFAEIYDYCERNGIRIVGEYADRHLTGTNDRRPEFQRMMKDAAKGRVQLVVCWKVDRFARNRYDSAMYKARLKKYGVRVVYAKESIPDGPEGILLESVLEGSAEYYSANLSQNIRRGMRANALECKVNNGNLPLGYCKGPDGRFAIEPAGAEIVRDVFAMYLDGMSPTEICAELNARGLRTSRGARYNKNSLRVMLRNERYVGVYEYGDVRIEGGVPAIITKETFDMAQEIIAKNARAPAASWSRVDYLLTGRLFCGKCGSPMVGESGTSKTGAKHNYYICATKKRRRACDKKTVRKEWIEELVVRETLQRVLVDDVIERIADAVVDLQRREQEEGEIPILQKQLAEVERSLKNVMTAIEQGIITQTTKARLEELEEQRRQISDRIEAVRFETPELSREQIIYWLEKFRGGDATDPAFQWKVIENFVNAVYLYDDQIRIVYNYTKQGAETVDLNFVEGLAEASGDGFGFGARCSTKSPGCLYIRDFFIEEVYGIIYWKAISLSFAKSFTDSMKSAGENHLRIFLCLCLFASFPLRRVCVILLLEKSRRKGVQVIGDKSGDGAAAAGVRWMQRCGQHRKGRLPVGVWAGGCSRYKGRSGDSLFCGRKGKP